MTGGGKITSGGNLASPNHSSGQGRNFTSADASADTSGESKCSAVFGGGGGANMSAGITASDDPDHTADSGGDTLSGPAGPLTSHNGADENLDSLFDAVQEAFERGEVNPALFAALDLDFNSVVFKHARLKFATAVAQMKDTSKTLMSVVKKVVLVVWLGNVVYIGWPVILLVVYLAYFGHGTSAPVANFEEDALPEWAVKEPAGMPLEGLSPETALRMIIKGLPAPQKFASLAKPRAKFPKKRNPTRGNEHKTAPQKRPHENEDETDDGPCAKRVKTAHEGVSIESFHVAGDAEAWFGRT